MLACSGENYEDVKTLTCIVHESVTSHVKRQKMVRRISDSIKAERVSQEVKVEKNAAETDATTPSGP